MNRILLVFGFLVVVLLCMVQFVVSVVSNKENAFNESLNVYVPKKLVGWDIRDQPLANSPEMEKKVEEILSYDDVINRSYIKDKLRIDVYVAYWRPGKMPYAFVGYHKPDVCWVSTGWKRKEKKIDTIRYVSNKKLLPFEHGILEKDGTIRSALYWHIVGGKSCYYDYYGSDKKISSKLVRHYLLPLIDVVKGRFSGPKEQILVRVSYEGRFDELWGDPRFEELMLSLKDIGVFERK